MSGGLTSSPSKTLVDERWLRYHEERLRRRKSAGGWAWNLLVASTQ